MVCSGNPNMNKAEHKIMFFGKQTLFVDHHTTQDGHRAGVLPGLRGAGKFYDPRAASQGGTSERAERGCS